MVIDIEGRTLRGRVFRALDDTQIDEFGWTK
jgi:hypothetical protein